MSDPPVVAFKKRGRTGVAARKRPASDEEVKEGEEEKTKLVTAAERKKQQREGEKTGPAFFKSSIGEKSELVKMGDEFRADLEQRRKERTSATSENIEREGPKKGAPGSGMGPKALSGSIRTSSSLDYRPCICKPYYETGRCKYGDTCKFAHIREDYANMHDIDREWEEAERRRKEGKPVDSDSDDSDDEEKNPLQCFLCREEFTDPVAAKCGHVFCAECAMKLPDKCQRCGQPTHGVFNTAHRVVKQLELKKAREKRAARKAAAGESESEEEEDVDETAPKRQGERFATSGWLMPADFRELSKRGKTSWL